MNKDLARLKALTHSLGVRSKVEWAIRSFFHRQDFLEVSTPVRLVAPALEDHIEAEPSGDHYLRTSPELHMKRLLAAGYGKIMQMGSCFRQGERGPLHNPEYTMLEWYRAGADYRTILADTEALIKHVALEVVGSGYVNYQGQSIDFGRWEIMPVAVAFQRYAGWDPRVQFDEDRFDLDLVEKVEPALPRDVPVVLIDYPLERGALARRKDDDPRVAERWELYIGGVEIANAYSELSDAHEQRQRFLACAEYRQRQGRPVYPLDEEFLGALVSGMPPAGGIALGVDRLAMILANAPSLDGVMAFRE